MDEKRSHLQSKIGPRFRLLIFHWLTILVLVTASHTASNTAVGLEQPVIRETNYLIPPGAIFVATYGRDEYPGTQAFPLRTIGTAIESAQPGGTIVLRAGTYREGDFHFSKRLTIQPYPRETVWIKGSKVLTEWVPDGHFWRHDNWTYRFPTNSYDRGAIDPEYPNAGKPDMVFVDSLPLAQVGALAQMSSNTFYVDYASKKLYISVDPTGRTVEAAAHSRALNAQTASANGTRIRGLGFMHYAGHRFAGTLQCDGPQVTFENNTVAWGASRGLAVYNSKDTVVRGNTLILNGQMGLAGWQTDGLIVEGNRLAGNNQERFVIVGDVAEASGSKIAASNRLVIRDNEIEENLGNGFWLDVSVYDATIVGNTARNNSGFGIFYEISTNAIIAGNLVTGNDDAGISISNSSDVRIYNNTLADNTINVAVSDDSRVNTDPDQLALGITWITSDVVLRNNIMSNTSGDSPLVYARDFDSNPLKDAEDMITGCNFNAYYRTQSSSPAILVEWWRAGDRNDFENLPNFVANSRYERNGLGIDDVVANPFFVDAAKGDYNLQPTSIARCAGSPLPVDVANALGLSPGVRVDLGAFQFSGPQTNEDRVPPGPLIDD